MPTTTTLDTSTAIEVARCFALGTVACEPSFAARGAMGEVWHLVTDTGRWAVKALFEWADHAHVPRDVVVQEAAAATGIPLPRLRRAAGGEVVVPVRDLSVRVYEWVDLGAPFDPPVTVETAEEAGRLLGVFHALALPPEPADVTSWFTDPPQLERFVHLSERSKANAAPWAEDLAASLPSIEPMRQLTSPSQRPTIVGHADFDPSNVLPARDGLVVLDWENACALQPERELAYAVWGWAVGSGRLLAPSARAFYDGYAAGGGTATVDDPTDFTMAIATWLNYLAVMVDQALDHTDAGHAEFARQVVPRLLHGLAGVPHIVDDLLAALR